jgi:hypothetical protein
MGTIKQINLLDFVLREHSEGIEKSNSNRSLVILIKFGDHSFRSPEMVNLIKKYWKPDDEDILFIINLEKIDIITPSVAQILIESFSMIAAEYKKPIIFNAVSIHTAEALNNAAITSQPPIPIWVERVGKEIKLMGQVPDRFKGLLVRLEEIDHPCSAVQIVRINNIKESKKSVNRYSVYLQDMLSLGLLGRTKVKAGQTQDRARGWTYLYFRPNDKSLTNIERIETP